jgi:hypothetical protein
MGVRRAWLRTGLVLVLAAGCATPAAPAVCRVTVPNRSTPPSEHPSPNHHGNGRLWTGIPEGGRVFVGTETRVGAEKFWWWRGPGVRGKLTVTGRRLDGPAPPLEAEIPDGYGESGFQATRLIFPSDGCWRVTGRVGEATLTFVVRAV